MDRLVLLVQACRSVGLREEPGADIDSAIFAS